MQCSWQSSRLRWRHERGCGDAVASQRAIGQQASAHAFTFSELLVDTTVKRSEDVKDEIVLSGNDIDAVSRTWYARKKAWQPTCCCCLMSEQYKHPSSTISPHLSSLPVLQRAYPERVPCEEQGYPKVPRRHLCLPQGDRHH